PTPRPERGRFDPLPEWAGPTTRLVHGARRPDWNAGAVVPPIYQTSTFHFPAEHSEGAERGGTYLYSRMENPTVEVPTELIRQLEGGEAARLFASGMGAITATVLSLVNPGDEVVAVGGLYGGTTDLLTELLPRFGVRSRSLTETPTPDPEGALGTESRLVVLESPTNPLLHVQDIARWASECDRAGALLLVDNTFASPINQRPLALGADLVVHSGTKYLGGHSDLLAGALVGARRLVDRVDAKRYFGAPLDPFAAYLLGRSLKTLALRVARQNENGARVAAAAASHPAVARVHYPGRASPEEESVAARQMRGRGGVVSLSLRGGESAVDRFLRALRFVHVAASLGGVESLASVPRLTSHRNAPRAELLAAGIDDGLVRIAFGIEDTEDLVRDVLESLDAVERPARAPPL
ncbi:MAG: PLP-dependent aspartate aminotransferase family protein, partial [Thermoplasmata archaeon]